jgi:cellulose synthase/poly-beta-1,6-N-acetylglucosamine synthase-like glycosyltransferase
MLAFLLIISLLPFAVEMVLLAWALRCVRRERRVVRTPYAPRVAVIAPHYGWDAGAEANAARLLRQDYPGEYQVYFVTHIGAGGPPDDSYRPLQRLTAGDSRARVLLAPNVVDHALGRSQKAENLLTALAAVPDDVAAFAFVDADACIASDWLRRLIEPLQEEKVGITTGARFYAPLVPSVPAYTEAVWVNYQIPLYGDPRVGMVWGGSSAIRREVLEEGGVRRRWRRALFEDQHLTKTMADLGKRIHFVPDCITVNFTGDRSWRQVFEFTNRQMGVTYWMRLRVSWWLALTHLLPKGVVFAASIPLTILVSEWYALLLAVPVLESFSYLLFTRTLPASIREDRRVGRTMLLTSLTVPLAFLVGGINALFAPLMRSITWGGVRYAYRDPEGCLILGRVEKKRVVRRERWWGGWVRRARAPLVRLLQVEPRLELEDVSKEE